MVMVSGRYKEKKRDKPFHGNFLVAFTEYMFRFTFGFVKNILLF